MSPRNWAFDIVLAVAVGVLGQLEAWWGVGSTHRQGPLWAQSLLYALTASLLMVRRRHPLGCLTAMVAISVVEFVAVGSPEGFAVSLAPLIAVYTVGSRSSWRRAWLGLVLILAFGVSWVVFDPMSLTWRDRAASLVWLTPMTLGWLLGAFVRVNRLNVEQRRINREQQAANAVAEERNRIARELHDVIGHGVSVMTVQASAVRRRLTAEQTAERQALEAVETTGREALAEMRRMVGVLRRDVGVPDLAPTPGLDQLDRLVETFRAAGLPVSVSVTGADRALSPGLDLTAYRLVQEGLTNILRHARNPSRAELSIDYRDDELRLEVRDDGETTEMTGTGGAGLVGMRERVVVYGGTLAAGARADGGFELVVRLPLRPPA